MKKIMAFLIGVASAQAVHANAPGTSLRPVARGDLAQAIIQDVTPRVLGVRSQADTPERKGVLRLLRPRTRSDSGFSAAIQSRKDRRRGTVCNDRELVGEPVGYVPGKMTGCGVQEAIRLRAVSGVALSRPATMDCGTAKALKTWVEKGMKPAVGRRGGGVAEMRILAGYSCRTRNSRNGARISEHGKGRAIDIGGFVLKNGKEISVLKNWGKRREGRILRKMHKSACGPFGTVLGPESDRYHRDHFHFDTARYRSGSYCR
ncbi:extensin family protein [Thalassovita aquimarina]|uniref:Extensin family protein n=1 Tax=Thalassovita aquimarina TaxID=2785917 RepID=A0ABS5HW66_9RHOB|nr:extensin family protein [Thalassovita aquimarina]MBR9653199.1 extensin family protein [Thalassovita aquimarina]